MSLSKYFKNSDSFQPDIIGKTQIQDKSGWKTLVKERPSDPFQAGEQVKKTANPVNAGENDSNPTYSPEKSPPPPTPTPPSPQNSSKRHVDKNLNLSAQLPDPSKYIEISELEKQVKKAYESGVQEGLQKAEEDYGSVTKAFATLCQQLDTIRGTIISNSIQEIQEFTLAIAERIIRTSLRDNDSTIVATIDEALQRAVKSEEFYIYIHPDDYDTVTEKSSELITGLSGLSNIVIKKDITVEKGGAKIESDNCTIDATIAGQFDVILEEIKKR